MMSTQLVMLHRTKSMTPTAEIDTRPGHVDPSREMTPKEELRTQPWFQISNSILVVRHIPCTSQVRVIIKDFNERAVFAQTFPGGTMLICLYYMLTTFCREITTDKLGITSGEKILAIEMLIYRI